ncbi:MAG: hypothetical protein P8R42_27820 [Candidatus Binatia bacterium]|nr:hypothetical protein [Candidatus Binatia bacterium]
MSLRPVESSEEGPHAASDELGWGESYSFHFVDPKDRLALLSRIGVRPNEGIMDVGLDVYVADGGLLAARHVRSQSENTADLEVEGVRYEMVRPLEEWKLSYDGPAHSLRSSRDAASHDAWHKSRLERLSIDLTFRAEAPAAASDAAPGKFGQAGRFTGEVWVSGDEYRVDVPGVREKTWGALGNTIPRMRRRFWVRFDDGSALVVDRRVEEEADVHSGWILEGGVLRALTEVRVETETEPDSFWQKSVKLTFVDDAGAEGSVSGEILQLAPLPSVRGTVHAVVCSSVARFQWGDRSGMGIADYLHQLDASGQPVLPIAEWG